MIVSSKKWRRENQPNICNKLICWPIQIEGIRFLVRPIKAAYHRLLHGQQDRREHNRVLTLTSVLPLPLTIPNKEAKGEDRRCVTPSCTLRFRLVMRDWMTRQTSRVRGCWMDLSDVLWHSLMHFEMYARMNSAGRATLAATRLNTSSELTVTSICSSAARYLQFKSH